MQDAPGAFFQLIGYSLIGRSLTRLPVILKTALPIAGATGINGGSPSPVGNSSLGMKRMSSSGTSAILSGV